MDTMSTARKLLATHRVPNGPIQTFATMMVLGYLGTRYGKRFASNRQQYVIRAINK